MQILIIAPCVVPGVDGVGEHADADTVVTVGPDTAHLLVRLGRALYADKADDATRGKYQTADAERVRRAKGGRRKAADAPSEPEAE